MSFDPKTLNSPDGRQHRLKPVDQRYLYSTTQYFFGLEDLERLKPLVDARPKTEGTVSIPESGTQELVKDIRRSTLTWLEPSKDTEWLYSRIGEIIRYHNQTYYGYDLQGLEQLQFTEYPEGGCYQPHMDWGSGLVAGTPGVCRKLSFTIQLSNPDSYEGGDFNIVGDTNFHTQRDRIREFGTIIVFPSWILHEVTPVTRGVRRSLVGWVLGPEFR